MAIVKILQCRGQSGSSALDYVVYRHDESTRAPVLDESGNRELREDFYLSGINCAPLAFPTEMIQLESIWGKNLDPKEIRMYQIIISYNPRDAEEYILDGPRAQMLSMKLVHRCFTGTLGIACTHLDGDHHAGNIHTHVFLSSIQYTDEISLVMKYPVAEKAGDKLDFSRATVMEVREQLAVLVQQEKLHSDNLFLIPGDRISNGEFWATYRGQLRLEEENQKRRETGMEVDTVRFQGKKALLREALKDSMFQSASVEEFRGQLESQYQVTLTESGRYWRFGFIGDDQDYASSTLGAHYYKEEICRVIENNRQNPERMEAYLAEKARIRETEDRSSEPDVTTLPGCREMFQEKKGDPVFVATVRRMALRMETSESPENLLEKWTPLAVSLQFVVKHQIRSLAQLDPLEKTIRGDLAFYHAQAKENDRILRDRINSLHYARVLEQHTDPGSSEEGETRDYKREYPRDLREVEDARQFFRNAGIEGPISGERAWQEKMSVQRISDHYRTLEGKARTELQLLGAVRTALEPWKELLPSNPVPFTHVLEMITPGSIRSQKGLLDAYRTQYQFLHTGDRSELFQSPVKGETMQPEHAGSEFLPFAVGFGGVSYDYILWSDPEPVFETDKKEAFQTDREIRLYSDRGSEYGPHEYGKTGKVERAERDFPADAEPHAEERNDSGKANEEQETDFKEALEEGYNERIRKLMERRNAAAKAGTAAERDGEKTEGKGAEDTRALIAQARAGIHLAGTIEEDSRTEREYKVAQRADRDAARKRRAAMSRTGDKRERGEQPERGGNRKKQSRYSDLER